jgi:CheY-like chemotaxis protein
MIVDDDTDVSQLQATILESAGMSVLCVNQPLLSLHQAAQFQPDLVILDMQMPKMNGIELAVLLRQDPDFLLLPIIFLTADTNAKLLKEITDLGVNALISKPINPKELLHHCEQVLLNTDALKNRISRITQRNQQPQQITRSYFFSAIDNELHNKPIGKDLSALYYISVTNLETLAQEINTTDLINTHEMFCNHLSQNINSDEQWVDLSNLVACVLAGKHSPGFHQERCSQLAQQLTDKLYAFSNNQKTLSIHIGVAYLNKIFFSAAEPIKQAERVLYSGHSTTK